MSRKLNLVCLIMTAFAVVFMGTACSNSSDPTDDNGGTTPVVESTECINCHTDEERLIATAEEEEDPGGEEPSGEG